MTAKDFTGWHGLKHHVHHSDKNRPSFKEREVWWCMIGLNIGSEQDGKGDLASRPVLVVRKFNREVFLGVPFTTKIKENPYYLRLNFKEKEQCALIAQLRVFDVKRLTKKMGELSKAEFETVRQTLRGLF